MEIDYSILTGAVSFTQIITVLLGVAATIIAFILVKNHISTIILFLGDRGIGSNSISYMNADSDREYENDERRRGN